MQQRLLICPCYVDSVPERTTLALELRPTGIQIATKSYAALQAMAPTNIKTVHQTSLLHIESNLDRLGMLSPTHDQRSQQKTGKITLQPVLINKSKFLKATHFVQK